MQEQQEMLVQFLGGENPLEGDPGILHFIVAIVNGASIAVISFILLFDHGNAINF